jgi:MGT family glycosyltransferase
MISQMPESFDFPRGIRNPHLFYTGPFRDIDSRKKQPFPWERLNGRPLVYASLGTVRNKTPRIFQLIAEACAPLDVQLVIALGGGSLTPEDLGSLPGDPVVVHYAPQIELLQKAFLTITHAGLNTTLESLAEGVPIIAVPVADDQPGVAARIKWSGVGQVIHPRNLTVNTLRSALQEIFHDERYRHAAQGMKLRIGIMDGASAAAEIAENVLGLVSVRSDRS